MTEQWTHIPVPGVGVAAHLGRCSPQVDVLASGEVGAKDGRCSPCLVSTWGFVDGELWLKPFGLKRG